MGILTALLYGALLVYMGGWIFDMWVGNFALVLMVLTLVTFAYWLAERFVFYLAAARPRRRPLSAGRPSSEPAAATSVVKRAPRSRSRSFSSHGGSIGRQGSFR